MAIVASALGLVSAGCATTDHVPEAVVECTIPKSRPPAKGPALVGKEYGMQIRPVPVDAVMFIEQRVANAVAVQALYATRTRADTVQVTARFLNCSERPIVVTARTSFLNEAQAPTEPSSAWQRIFLLGKSTALYTESSLARHEVSNYLIEVGGDQ